MQMLDLPHKDEGLAWIASQGLSQLPLISSLQAAYITAAAEGDEQALAYVRCTAEEHARHFDVQRPLLHEALRLLAPPAAAQSDELALRLQSPLEEGGQCAIQTDQEAT